jgi:two-component system NtrC family sensor kinase
LTLAIKPVRLTGETGTDGLSGAFVAILMADTGTGIPAEILPRVFEPFFTTKEVGKGTGLGLSQVHGFAKQSGGTVTVSSNPERGTTITLYLPCSTERPQPMAVVDTGEIFVPGGGIVLVVEDNADVATVCTEHLEELGFRVKHSPSARAALDFLKDNDSIDLVLSDILMPGGMNGLELAHLLREQRPNLPVVLITGYSGNAEDAARHGFKVLRKPFDVGALAKAVQEVVGTSWTTT